MTGGGTEVVAALSGLNQYLKSPNGKYWRLTIADDGTITGVDTGTDPPADGPVPADPE